MTDITQAVAALNSLSPLAVIGLLAYVIYLQVKNQKGQTRIATNHLHELPQMAADLSDMKMLLQTMNDNIVYIRARVNGK